MAPIPETPPNKLLSVKDLESTIKLRNRSMVIASVLYFMLVTLVIFEWAWGFDFTDAVYVSSASDMIVVLLIKYCLLVSVCCDHVCWNRIW